MDNESPYQFLAKYIGKRIQVRLKDSECYEGKLVKIQESEHGFLGNILLHDANRVNPDEKKVDWLLIRGNNIAKYLLEI